MELSPITAVSPLSLLKSVLSSAVEAELTHLQVEVKDLVKGIQLLMLEVHEDLTGRYVNFDKFDISDDSYLLAAQTFNQDLENITLRIADGQIKSDHDYSTQEFHNLQVAITDSKTDLSVIYQLLSIDCALKSVIEASGSKNYLDAALSHSQIAPMFAEICDSKLYQPIQDALKKECNIACTKLKFYLGVVWKKTVSWHETGEILGSKLKSVSLKVLNDQDKPRADILLALSYIGSLHSTFSIFGMSLLKLFLVPVMKHSTKIAISDFKTHTQICVEIITSKERPPLSMVITNLKVVFEFLNKEMNIVLEDGASTMRILGGFISKEFSKCFLKECLTDISERVQQDFCQTLEDFRDLVHYLCGIEFLQCDYLIQYLNKIFKAENNPSFLECATLLEKANLIMKKDTKETISMYQDSTSRPRADSDLPDVYPLAKNGNTEDGSLGGTPFIFPLCRISKWIVELVDLLGDTVAAARTEGVGHRSRDFLRTARRIVDLYAAITPGHQRSALESRPLAIALFYNNTMFLARQLVLQGFDIKNGIPEDHPIFISADLVHSLRSTAMEVLLKYLNEQRAEIVEKTKAVDLSCPSNLESTLKECMAQTDYLQSAWKDVLPATNYTKAMDGILNLWLEELTNLISHAESIPGNTAHNIAMVYQDVADMISALVEKENNINLQVSRLSSFRALIDILDSSLPEIDWKWTNGTLARDFSPQHVEQFVRVLFGHLPACTDVLSRIK